LNPSVSGKRAWVASNGRILLVGAAVDDEAGPSDLDGVVVVVLRQFVGVNLRSIQ
jgi:hypothetical protein